MTGPSMSPLLTIWASILLPLAAAALIPFAAARHAKWIATAGSFLSLAAITLHAWHFPAWMTGAVVPDAPGPEWIPGLGITLSVGFDSVALLLALLTAFLMPLCLIGSFTAVQEREREYYAWFSVLAGAMLLAFAAKDAILFYIGYEFTLIPMTLLIAIYGGTERRPAAIKYFLYTFLGSLFMLAGLLYLAWQHRESTGQWSFDIAALTATAVRLPSSTQFWLFAALICGFAVKIPLFPVHTWLPLAHDQAPTGGSVILAGSMLKLGSYGVYRFAMPMAPAGGVELMVLMGILCLVAIVYASLICWVQQDAKKLVAYSSVAHLGLSMLGLFSLNPLGAEGSVFYWVNHGLSTGALFLCIGMFYERYHTKDMERLGGLARVMPVWACFMVFFVMASAGLPGLNGFVGEILCIGGTFIAEHDAQSGYPGVLGPSFAVVAGTGMILAAMYLLILLGKIVWGPLREPHDTHAEPSGHPVEAHAKLPRDLSAREIGILMPLAVACLVLGLYPKPMLEAIAPCVEKTLAAYPAQVERIRAAETVKGSTPSQDSRAAAGSPADAPGTAVAATLMTGTDGMVTP